MTKCGINRTASCPPLTSLPFIAQIITDKYTCEGFRPGQSGSRFLNSVWSTQIQDPSHFFLHIFFCIYHAGMFVGFRGGGLGLIHCAIPQSLPQTCRPFNAINNNLVMYGTQGWMFVIINK